MIMPIATVGDFIEEVKTKAGGRPKTIKGYSKALRCIVADIFESDGGTAKYDYRTGGRDKWLAKVEAVLLSDVTPRWFRSGSTSSCGGQVAIR